MSAGFDLSQWGDEGETAKSIVRRCLSEHACCFSDDDAQGLVDAVAHELAEQIRTTPMAHDYDPDDAVRLAADLIDPQSPYRGREHERP